MIFNKNIDNNCKDNLIGRVHKLLNKYNGKFFFLTLNKHLSIYCSLLKKLFEINKLSKVGIEPTLIWLNRFTVYRQPIQHLTLFFSIFYSYLKSHPSRYLLLDLNQYPASGWDFKSHMYTFSSSRCLYIHVYDNTHKKNKTKMQILSSKICQRVQLSKR